MENNDKEQLKKDKEEHANIYEALAAVTREISPIAKDQTNEQQRFKYRGIENFLNEIHNLYARHGIMVFTDVSDISETERTTKNNTLMFYPKATVTFTFMHESGSSHTATVIGSAMDSGDKGLNKCYSIAYKYALTFLHNVPTSVLSDPDGNTPGDLKPSQQPQRQQQPRPQPQPQPQQPKGKGIIEEKGSKSYNDALAWLKKDPIKNTISKLQANYVVDAKTLTDLAIDAGIPTGGTRPSKTKQETNKTPQNEQSTTTAAV